MVTGVIKLFDMHKTYTYWLTGKSLFLHKKEYLAVLVGYRSISIYL